MAEDKPIFLDPRVVIQSMSETKKNPHDATEKAISVASNTTYNFSNTLNTLNSNIKQKDITNVLDVKFDPESLIKTVKSGIAAVKEGVAANRTVSAFNSTYKPEAMAKCIANSLASAQKSFSAIFAMAFEVSGASSQFDTDDLHILTFIEESYIPVFNRIHNHVSGLYSDTDAEYNAVINRLNNLLSSVSSNSELKGMVVQTLPQLLEMKEKLSKMGIDVDDKFKVVHKTIEDCIQNCLKIASNDALALSEKIDDVKDQLTECNINAGIDQYLEYKKAYNKIVRKFNSDLVKAIRDADLFGIVDPSVKDFNDYQTKFSKLLFSISCIFVEKASKLSKTTDVDTIKPIIQTIADLVSNASKEMKEENSNTNTAKQ